MMAFRVLKYAGCLLSYTVRAISKGRKQ